MSAALQSAAAWIAAFPRALRAAGMPVAPDQTIGFLAAIHALGPRSLSDIRRAGIAMMAVAPEREPLYHALFDAHFLGAPLADEQGAQAPDEAAAEAHEPTGAAIDLDAPDDTDPAGDRATFAERAADRGLLHTATSLARARLPERLSYRRQPARRGDAPDRRRTLRDAVRLGGEPIRLHERRRRRRPRRICLMIDVSGSMRGQTDAALAIAHALAQRSPALEAFTLGTRLTRITRALRPREATEAMARVAALVSDLDGGTRLGDTLSAFLAVPRFAGAAKGALTIVVSDGLERGDPAVLADAAARLSRSAWALHWLSPLMAEPGFRPEQTGLAAVLPHLDRLAPGATEADIARHILSLAGGRR